MKERLQEVLEQKRKEHKLFVPYLTFGYPSVPDFLELARICAEEGVDALEVGIPYSDPVADGPVIQTTSYRALLQGVTPLLVKETMEKTSLSLPLVAMTYGNIVFRYGVDQFARDFSRAGFRGLIVADFPLEAKSLLAEANGFLEVILLLAVNSSPERIARIGEESKGFVYLVSGKGTTGAVDIDLGVLEKVVSILRSCTVSPVLVGFGIHSPSRAREVASVSDGVIVGSALLDFILKHQSERNWKVEFGKLLREYRQALGG
ncbi:MAG: tryptophan synthase subunit alpha [Candidatus Atribacteria bacterium]|nr:tryptophan synthase subunit alpha [Candidatus Atribacteria bacterium]